MEIQEEEQLAYYSDIVGLVDLNLMKTVHDDTYDDPKPKRVKETKDINSKIKKRIQTPQKDDIDEDAGPTTPKQKFKRKDDSREDGANQPTRDSFKKKKYEERNESNSFQRNNQKFTKGGKFDRKKQFDKGGKPGKKFNRQ